jgi:hypothetical protein
LEMFGMLRGTGQVFAYEARATVMSIFIESPPTFWHLLRVVYHETFFVKS